VTSLSANGLVAVWSSNGSGQYQTYAKNLVTSALTNLANSYSIYAGVSGDRSQYGFVSSANLTGQNPAQRQQMFLACGGNRPPVADAGSDQTVTVPTATATVTLDGTGSHDVDGDPLTYAWTGPFGTASGAQPTVTLPVGTHTIALSVTDGISTSSDTVTVKVVQAASCPTPTARAKSGLVQVSWPAFDDADGYTVYRGTVTGGPYANVASLGAGSLSYLDRSVTNGITYYYVIAPTGPSGELCQSPEASAMPRGR
jgi:hypothetical protein